MGLDQQLADCKAEFLRTAPAGRAALYEAKIKELRAGFALEAAGYFGPATPARLRTWQCIPGLSLGCGNSRTWMISWICVAGSTASNRIQEHVAPT
jgi:hypothetical protein